MEPNQRKLFQIIVFFSIIFFIIATGGALSQTSINGALQQIGDHQVLNLWGTYYEMGYAHGYLMADKIRDLVDNYMIESLADGSVQSYNSLLDDIADNVYVWHQQSLDEINGMAAGMADSGISLWVPKLGRDIDQRDIKAFNLQEEFFFACSSFGVWGSATATGETILGRNFDFYYDNQGNIANYQIIITFEPEDGTKFISFSWPGMIGIFSGMNETGVSLTVNSGMGNTSRNEPFHPVVEIYRNILENTTPDNFLTKPLSIVNSVEEHTTSIIQIGIPFYEYNDPVYILEDASDQNLIRYPWDTDPDYNHIIATNHFIKVNSGTTYDNSVSRYNSIRNGLINYYNSGDGTVDSTEAWSLLDDVADIVAPTLLSVVIRPDKMEFDLSFATIINGRFKSAVDIQPQTHSWANLFPDDSNPTEPDLIIQNVATIPEVPLLDQPVSVTVTVKNQGSRIEGNYAIDFYQHLISAPVSYQFGDASCYKSGLEAGATDSCSYSITFSAAGSYQMWAQVDTNEEVTEFNETNNVFGPQIISVVGANTPPEADFIATPVSGDTPISVSFTDQSTGSINSYSWNFGDGGTSTLQNPSHTYTVANTYNVSLTVTGTGGSDTNTKIDYITVTVPSGPVMVSFQEGVDGYTGMRDTKLLSSSPNTNYGSAVELEVDGSPDYSALLYWDVTSIPTASTIESVTISLTVTGSSSDRYEFYEMKRPWIENEASWNGFTSGEDWDVPGANGLLDRGSIVLGSVTGSVGTRTASLNAAGVLLVQSWVDDPSLNHGFVLLDYINSSDGLDFYSRETQSSDNRPIMMVTYLGGGPPPPPAADFIATPVSGDTPLSVSFTDQSTGDISTYSWDFGDGSTSTLQNPSHTYTVANTYTVDLTVTGLGGSDINTKVDYITVAVPPPPVSDFIATPVSGETPLSVSFTDQSSGDISSYSWDFGDGSTSTLQNPSHTYTVANTYTVDLTVTGLGGSDINTKVDYITVAVPPPPEADFIATPVSGETPLSVSFTDQSSGDISSYTWDFGDGGTSTLKSPSHIYTAANSYTVSLTVTGLGGSDINTKADYIIVTVPSPPLADFVGLPESGVAPLAVSFSDLSTGIIDNYSWDFGDGNTSMLQSPLHTYTSANTYTVSLTATGPGGSNTSTKIDYITVITQPPPVAKNDTDDTTKNIPVTTDVLANDSDPNNDPLTVYSLTQPANGFAVNNGNGTITYTPILDFVGEDSYFYTISDGNGAYATASVTITVSETPVELVVFSESFESGLENWRQDTQNDWFRSTQRATDGAYSAEVDGTARDAQLISMPIDLQGGTSAAISFSWYIERGLDTGEYIAFDISTDGELTWIEKVVLKGNVDQENTWHNISVEISNIENLTLRFRGLMSSSREDANIDNVIVTATGTEPPVADFVSSSVNGETPLSVFFTDLSEGYITSYSWDFGDGNTSTLQSPSYTYTTTNTYTVSLTVTGPGGSDTNTKVDYITVTVPQPPVADFVGLPVSGETPLVVSFTDQSTGNISSYSWDFGDGNTSTLQNPSHSYTIANTYTVNLTVTGPGGSDTNTKFDYITVTVPSPPVADFVGLPVSGETPLIVSFTDQSTGNINSYSWDFGDGNTSTLQNPSHTYTVANTYTVSLTVTGPGGSDTNTKVDHITVTVPSPPMADFIGLSVSGPAPLVVSFTDQSTGDISSYSWDFGDGSTSTLQNPSHTYTVINTYNVSLTVTGPGGIDTNTKIDYITVTVPLGPLMVSFQEGVDGYTGMRDTKLLSSSPNSNYGSSVELEVDGSPDYSALLYWDVTSIPIASTIESVTISLTVTGSSSDRYEFYEMKRPWIENEASWNGFTSGEDWDVPGANGLLDRGSIVLGSITGSIGTRTTSLNTAGVALVQSWMDDPSSNHGFILMDYTNSTDGLDFYSRETQSSGNRPIMMVTYLGGGAPSPIPVADFIATPVSGDTPLSISFTDQSTGDISSYSWDFGDGSTSTLQNPSHTYTVANTYTVELTVTGASGSDTNTKIDYITVTINTNYPGFDTLTLTPSFEINGIGRNIDSVAFWETPDPTETLLFVTAKDNNLLEVWKYPFLGNELSPIEFSSTVNGVAVDQEMDLLYVTESSDRKVSVFTLPDYELQREFGQGDLGNGETNLDLLKHVNNQTWSYVTDDNSVHWFNTATGMHLGEFSPPVSSIETVLADDFYQMVLVPEESGPLGNPGVYAFHSDGTPFEKNGTNRFGNQGEFDSDEEGILLYTFPSSGIEDDGSGFIVVSDQKQSLTDFEFFDRQTWEHLGTLRIEGVSNTDGIASTQKALPDYPMGLFVAINNDSTTVGIGWDVILEKTGLSANIMSIH
ncbi:C45 family autoproteolytic acyltransferase/hydrolase [Acidobacteriota bacterium]